MNPVTASVPRLPGGVDLPYLDHGPPNALAILLLHRITDSCLPFETMIAHIAPSQRGHREASVHNSYRLEEFVLAAFWLD